MVILEFLKGILLESFGLLNKMSPYLLLGFFFAGILRVFFSPEKVVKHLGYGKTGPVIKAALFGIPLPLCSCGVIPAAVSLRRQGANKGATLSFLITIGITLFMEGMHKHVPKAYIYLPMGFALLVEILQMRYEHNKRMLRNPSGESGS